MRKLQPQVGVLLLVTLVCIGFETVHLLELQVTLVPSSNILFCGYEVIMMKPMV